MRACFPDIRVSPRLYELKLRRYRRNLAATRETFRLWSTGSLPSSGRGGVALATGQEVTVETSHPVVIAAMLQAMSMDEWSLLTNAITLLVIDATALPPLIHPGHIRA